MFYGKPGESTLVAWAVRLGCTVSTAGTDRELTFTMTAHGVPSVGLACLSAGPGEWRGAPRLQRLVGRYDCLLVFFLV